MIAKPKQRNRHRRAIRLQQWEADPHCRYCRRELTFEKSKLDHAIPLSRGGTNRRENLVLTCKTCNSRKADLMPDEILAWATRIVETERRQKAG